MQHLRQEVCLKPSNPTIAGQSVRHQIDLPLSSSIVVHGPGPGRERITVFVHRLEIELKSCQFVTGSFNKFLIAPFVCFLRLAIGYS